MAVTAEGWLQLGGSGGGARLPKLSQGSQDAATPRAISGMAWPPPVGAVTHQGSPSWLPLACSHAPSSPALFCHLACPCLFPSQPSSWKNRGESSAPCFCPLPPGAPLTKPRGTSPGWAGSWGWAGGKSAGAATPKSIMQGISAMEAPCQSSPGVPGLCFPYKRVIMKARHLLGNRFGANDGMTSQGVGMN